VGVVSAAAAVPPVVVASAQVPAVVSEAVADDPVDGTPALVGPATGRAAVPLRTVDVGRQTTDPKYLATDPRYLNPDDESLTYVEGRPGQELAVDLAEQRVKELPTTKQATRAQDERRRIMPLWQELPLLVMVSFCVAVLVRSFLVQAFLIPSSSMEDTLRVGDRVLVNKIVYTTRDPRRGEVVVFHGPDNWVPENLSVPSNGFLARIGDTLGDLVGVSRPGEKDFIKRVIGVPGDHVACCDEVGRVTVNGVGIDEPYLKSNNPLDLAPTPGLCGPRQFAQVQVPPGELFVMGDNRGVSQDSRCQGTIPIENVVGQAFLRVWPISHWGGVGTPGSLSDLPSAAGPTAIGPDPTSALLTLALMAPLVRRRVHRPPPESRWPAPRTLRR
jgi:signal peptidase I